VVAEERLRETRWIGGGHKHDLATDAPRPLRVFQKARHKHDLATDAPRPLRVFQKATQMHGRQRRRHLVGMCGSLEIGFSARLHPAEPADRQPEILAGTCRRKQQGFAGHQLNLSALMMRCAQMEAK